MLDSGGSWVDAIVRCPLCRGRVVAQVLRELLELSPSHWTRREHCPHCSRDALMTIRGDSDHFSPSLVESFRLDRWVDQETSDRMESLLRLRYGDQDDDGSRWLYAMGGSFGAGDERWLSSEFVIAKSLLRSEGASQDAPGRIQ